MALKLFKQYEKELKEFEEWISSDPRLPQQIEKLLLLRFLKVCDFDIDKAKELLLINLEHRKKHPVIFSNRDVLDDNFQQTLKTLQIVPMPKNSQKNHKISIFRLVDKDPEKYVYIDVCRTVVSMLDIRFVTVDENELIEGEIGIIDMTGFTFKHVIKCSSNLSVLKAYMKYIQEAAPFRIIQNHFINCSPIMDKFMTFLKPFMKKEIIETLKFHTGVETLYDVVPRELLPNEFGGTAGSIDDFYKDWKMHIESKRDYILNDDNWKLAN
ncbi:CLUMA_CG011865, isoform A [Clunio marinus]|uniref:CLUMA_CG011865, isoform A n=1 Tax=Clunio marinus TaxID=568069 RepID=A0A1J1IE26_9DIPT|nr:CLUMA_CG011865, isoform A [Clunio marinus]